MPSDFKTHTTVLPTNAAARLDARGRVFRNQPVLSIDPDVKRWILAREAILENWRRRGGPASSLGLPLDPQFSLVAVPGGAAVHFRGGSMTVMDDKPGAVQIDARRVVVTFEGYGLDIRQESGDELYGTLDCKIGSTGYKQTFDLLQVELGPSDDNRVYQSSIVLWDGPPADINIVANLAENDSGDRDKVREEMRKNVRRVFEVGKTLASGSIGAGLESLSVQSSLASESDSNSALLTWILDGAADLVTGIFGLGDDPYNPAAFTIFAAEMRHLPPLQTYRCWNDPRTIQFTHSRTVTGRDHGGDVGQITLLFRVRSVS